VGWSGEPGAEERVHDEIGLAERGRNRPELAAAADFLDLAPPARERPGRISLHVCAPADQKDADSRALGLEMAGSHESVTAVVALAAEDDDPLAPDGSPLAADDVRGAAAGILHEPRAGDPERGDRARIEGAHLGGRENRPHPYLALAEARRSAPWVRKSASTAV
jgi:hypothetical protein